MFQSVGLMFYSITTLCAERSEKPDDFCKNNIQFSKKLQGQFQILSQLMPQFAENFSSEENFWYHGKK